MSQICGLLFIVVGINMALSGIKTIHTGESLHVKRWGQHIVYKGIEAKQHGITILFFAVPCIVVGIGILLSIGIDYLIFSGVFAWMIWFGLFLGVSFALYRQTSKKPKKIIHEGKKKIISEAIVEEDIS